MARRKVSSPPTKCWGVQSLLDSCGWLVVDYGDRVSAEQAASRRSPDERARVVRLRIEPVVRKRTAKGGKK